MSTELTTQNAGAVQREESQAFIGMLERIAKDPSVDVQKMERVWAMKQEMDAQRRKENFIEALRLCQAEMPRVQKNGLIDPKGAKVPYARLEDLDACIRPIYQKYGFAVTFDAPMNDDGKIRVTARFSCGGHTEPLEMSAAPSNRNTGRLTMTNAQAIKQTITECRRHLLEMFFNIITVGADEMPALELITQNQSDDIRTRMNDLAQSRPGVLLEKLCAKYGVSSPEGLTTGQYESAVRDVEFTEKQKAAR